MKSNSHGQKRSQDQNKRVCSFGYPTLCRIAETHRDQGGMLDWVNRLQAGGWRQENIENGFFGSLEFYLNAGGTDRGFIRDLLFEYVIYA